MSTKLSSNEVSKSASGMGALSKILLTVGFLAVVSLAFYSFFQNRKITEKNQEIAALNQQNTEYLNEQQRLNDFIEEVTQTINEVGSRLKDLRQKQVDVTSILAAGETAMTVKDSLIADIAMIESQLVKDKQNLEDLQQKMKKSSLRIRALEEMVARLSKEIEKNQLEIASLMKALEEKEMVIRNTEATLVETQMDLTITSNKLQETEKILEDTRNTVYYIVGKAKELEQKNVIDRVGILWKKNVIAADFVKNDFTKADFTKVLELSIDSKVKEVNLVPPRNSKSYSLVENGEGKSVLKIIDREEFWKLPYLAVVLD